MKSFVGGVGETKPAAAFKGLGFKQKVQGRFYYRWKSGWNLIPPKAIEMIVNFVFEQARQSNPKGGVSIL